MSFLNKVKWVLGILMIFVLVLTTNLIDRTSFLQVRDSVVSIYEDRLVAKDLIFQMSRSFQEKELAVALSDSSFFSKRNAQVNTDIQNAVLNFEQTNLTANETKILDKFKNNFENLMKAESAFLQSNFSEKEAYFSQLLIAHKALYDLSAIQMSEGKREVLLSERAFASIELFTHIEIYFLIFLALVIQIIVIYNPKKEGE